MSYPSCQAFVGQNYVAETPAVAITINNLYQTAYGLTLGIFGVL